MDERRQGNVTSIFPIMVDTFAEWLLPIPAPPDAISGSLPLMAGDESALFGDGMGSSVMKLLEEKIISKGSELYFTLGPVSDRPEAIIFEIFQSSAGTNEVIQCLQDNEAARRLGELFYFVYNRLFYECLLKHVLSHFAGQPNNDETQKKIVASAKALLAWSLSKDGGKIEDWLRYCVREGIQAKTIAMVDKHAERIYHNKREFDKQKLRIKESWND